MRFITSIATAAFVVAGASAVSAAPRNAETFTVAQAKVKESPAVDSQDRDKKNQNGAPATQTQTPQNKKDKPEHPNTGINPSR